MKKKLDVGPIFDETVEGNIRARKLEKIRVLSTSDTTNNMKTVNMLLLWTTMLKVLHTEEEKRGKTMNMLSHHYRRKTMWW